ncbi:MAG: type II toxin-antitoxin system HicA family toxin [Chloroflexi bacterium]|nr:type II toxin-antitoxin system HicA family toxin [Chloroflexota bacterium]
MTQFDKLIARILARPPQVDFNDVRRLLEAYGRALDREKGSHVMFTKPSERTITAPKVGGRRVKRVYLNRIIEILGIDS